MCVNGVFFRQIVDWFENNDASWCPTWMNGEKNGNGCIFKVGNNATCTLARWLIAKQICGEG